MRPLSLSFSSERTDHRRLWIGVFTALFIHLIFLMFSKKLLFHTSERPKIEISTLSPEKLMQYKKEWEKKSLLLNKDTSPIDPSIPAPKNAKFSSDRNRAVKKEERAKVTSENPGALTPQPSPSKRVSEKTKTIPALKSLSPFGRRALPQQNQPDTPAAALKGGNQIIQDNSIPLGSENILNTEENHYYSFYSRVFEVTNPLWQSYARSALRSKRFNMGSYLTKAEILLDREGNFVEVRILSSSGEKILDDAIEKTWKKIARFPNPPKDLILEDGYVHTGWSFQVNIDEHAGFQALPPERDY